MTAISNELLINAKVADAQRDASVTLLADGRFVVAWLDEGNGEYPYHDIRYQIFHADGVPDGSERIASSDAAPGETFSKYFQSTPSVSALADGGFVVVYRDSRPSITEPYAVRSELVYQRFDASGNKVGGDITFTPALDGNNVAVSGAEPSALGLSNGNFVLVAHTSSFPDANAPNDDGGIVMRVFNAAGVALTGWKQVNATSASLQRDAQLTELSNGNFAVVWVSDTHLPFGWEVKAQVFSAAGVPVNGEIIFPSVESVGQFSRPQVAALDGGRFVVTWVRQPSADELLNQGLRTDIVAQIVDADGNLVGGNIAVHPRDGLSQENPVVAATEDGTFLIVWQDGNPTSGSQIRGQLFDSTGAAIGSMLTIGSTINPDDINPRITVTADGRFLVVWEDDTRNLAPSANDEIHGAFVDPRLTGVGFVGSGAAEEFVGTQFADILRGNGGKDYLAGAGGNDDLKGGNGNDLLKGGDGDDIIEGGQGADTMDGGEGVDTLSYATSGAVTVDLSANTFTGGHATGDIVSGFENLTGSSEADLFIGDGGNNVLRGQAGNDTLSGVDGNDTLVGVRGEDVLAGGLGRDTLTGGAEADAFVYTSLRDSRPGKAADLITDFVAGVDLIDLVLIDAIRGRGDDAFTFLGDAGAFTGAGQVRFEQDIAGSRTIVFINFSADAAAEMEIRLKGVIALTSNDFIL